MDKNIAALLREDAKTIEVRFFNDNFNSSPTLLGVDTLVGLSAKTYTYVTTLDLKKGDCVLVHAVNQMKVVYVDTVHATAEILPNSEISYRWVISKVDTSDYDTLMAENAKIETTVGNAYKKNIRKQFGQMLLAELGVEESEELKQLISRKEK